MYEATTSGTKLVDTLEKITLHDHLCLIYETQEEQFAAIMPFMRQGLERGERCLYIADDNTAAAVLQGMRDEGIDVDTATETEALVIATKRETYLRHGYFDPDGMIRFLEEATRTAQAAGFSALRMAGEMTWALGDDPGVERLIEYEAKLNRFFPNHDALAICQYNRARFAPEIIIQVIRTHPYVISGGMGCQNFYYVPPDEFLRPNQPDLEVQRLLDNIRIRELYDIALQKSNAELAALNAQLNREIADRRRAEAALKKAYDDLELRIEARTAELSRANQALKAQAVQTRRAHEELKREQTLLSQIMDTSPVGITLMDRQGQITLANARAEQVLGISRDEITERTYNAPDWQITDYEGRPFPDEALPFRQVLATGQSVYNVRHAILGPAGERRLLSINAAPILNQAGQVDGVVSIVEDVTAKVLADEALEESRRFAEKIADATPSMLYIYDLKEQRNVYTNRRATELLGYGTEEFRDMSSNLVPTIFHPDDQPAVQAHHRRCAAAGDDDILTIEYRLKARPGGWRWFQSRDVVFARDGAGAPVQILGAAMDITERKRSETALAQAAAELARSNIELEQFVHVVSHDLQEPVRMVNSYLDLLTRRHKSALNQEAQEFVDYALDGAMWMQTLINDLRQYSRVSTQGKSFEAVDAQQIFNQARANLQVAIQENQAVITHDPLPVVVVDGVQMVQVFQNMIANAIKFRSDRRPEIHVSAKRRPDDWLFSVRDNGIGLDPRHADRIFQVFQRLHTRTEYAGTGIGLALCRKIVERHGGRIWVDSEPGGGTTFYFTIPVKEAEG